MQLAMIYEGMYIKSYGRESVRYVIRQRNGQFAVKKHLSDEEMIEDVPNIHQEIMRTKLSPAEKMAEDMRRGIAHDVIIQPASEPGAGTDYVYVVYYQFSDGSYVPLMTVDSEECAQIRCFEGNKQKEPGAFLTYTKVYLDEPLPACDEADLIADIVDGMMLQSSYCA